MRTLTRRFAVGYRTLLPEKDGRSDNRVERFLSLQVPLLGVSLVILFALNSYWGYDTASFIFRGFDGWCNLQNEAIGYHCFGDFHQFVNIPDGELITIWDGSQIPNTSQGRFPIGAPIADFFTLFGRLTDPRLALFTWLLLSAIALLWPLWVATKHVRLTNRISALTILGLLTIPFWATIDRGQNASLLVPLLFIFVLACIRGKKRWVGVAAGLLFLVKPQFAILLIPVIATSGVTGLLLWAGTITIGLLGSFGVYGVDSFDRVVLWVQNIAHSPSYDISGDAPFASNYSVSAMSGSLGDLLQPLFPQVAKVLIASSALISTLVTLCLLLGLATLKKHISVSDYQISWLALSALFIPLAPSYYLVFVLVAVSLVVGGYFSDGEKNPEPSLEAAKHDFLLWVAICVSLAPLFIPVTVPQLQELPASPSDRSLNLTNAVPVLVCILWSVYIGRAIYRGLWDSELNRSLRGSRYSRKFTPGKVIATLLILLGIVICCRGAILQRETAREFDWQGQGEVPASFLEVGAGSGAGLELWPDLYRMDGPEVTAYFPHSDQGRKGCLGGQVTFNWSGVNVALTEWDRAEPKISHTFFPLGTRETRLALSPDGSTLSWVTLDGSQVIELPEPACLNLAEAKLAGSPDSQIRLVKRFSVEEVRSELIVGGFLVFLGIGVGGITRQARRRSGANLRKSAL